ncbi:hypothetical protein LTR74_002524 [Friedmanniomyces endolithicus]|nr:hypothetical protein LTR74_002524 [Friedmanniomyces endolithicus]
MSGSHPEDQAEIPPAAEAPLSRLATAIEDNDGLQEGVNNVDRLYCAKFQQIQDAYEEENMRLLKRVGPEILMDPFLPRRHRAAVTFMVSFTDIDQEPRLREALTHVKECEEYMDRGAVPADDGARSNIAELRSDIEQCLADLHDVWIEVTDSEGEDEIEETILSSTEQQDEDASAIRPAQEPSEVHDPGEVQGPSEVRDPSAVETVSQTGPATGEVDVARESQPTMPPVSGPLATDPVLQSVSDLLATAPVLPASSNPFAAAPILQPTTSGPPTSPRRSPRHSPHRSIRPTLEQGASDASTIRPPHDSSDGQVVSETDPTSATAGEETAGEKTAGEEESAFGSQPAGAPLSGPFATAPVLQPTIQGPATSPRRSPRRIKSVEDEYLAEDEGRTRSPIRRSPRKASPEKESTEREASEKEMPKKGSPGKKSSEKE